MSAKHQQGISLIGGLLTAVLLALVFVLGLRLVPVVTEYFAIKRALGQIAITSGKQSASVREVRAAFAKRIIVDDITSVDPADLEIDRDSGELTLSVSYARKVPLGYGVSLLIELDTSSSAPFGEVKVQQQ